MYRWESLKKVIYVTKSLFFIIFILIVHTMFETLTNSNIFRGVPPGTLEELFDNIHFQIKKYDKDQIIALSEERCNNLLVLLNGSVKGEMIDFSGKIIKIEDIEAPGTLAGAFLFGKNNRFPVNIVANKTVELLLIPKSSVIKLLQSSDIILENFLNAISSRTQFLSGKIKFLSFKTIKGKIAHYILDLDKEKSGIIILPKTQKELADYFGVTRPALARAIGEMKRDGIVDAKGKSIEIINREKMLKLLD